MKVAVVGLGKIGLPLAVQFAKKGNKVIGTDINQSTVDLVNQGLPPFPGENQLPELLDEVCGSGSLQATLNTSEAVGHSDVVVVAVPLFIDSEHQPDFSAMDAATKEIGKGLTPGTLVAFETTLPVGTTRNRLTPILERESGLSSGRDFYVVFSPERVLTGRVFSDLRKYPKLVGGIDENSEARGVKFYGDVLDFDARPELPKPNGVWGLGSAEAAELAKLAETTYRDVNIALANQFAVYSERIGVNVHEVIEACNSQQFSHIHQPGVAVGGHCIPVYPHLYLHGDPGATVVLAARKANEAMPIHVVDSVEEKLGGLSGKRIAILGLAYRGGVKEHAFSGAWDLISEISKRGGLPKVNDPLFSESELSKLGCETFSLGEYCDAAIIQADHREYLTLQKSDIPNATFLVDGRNVSSTSLRSAIETYVIGHG